MDYKLAKQLKDAGFPIQELTDNEEIAVAEGYFKDKGEPIHFPTLEELIDACGDKFKGLKRLRSDLWRSWGMKDSVIYVDKKTARESVAILWLILNE